jgi:hypothetical protein
MILQMAPGNRSILRFLTGACARRVPALDGQPVAGVDDLHRLLTDARVGVSNPLTVLRHTERLEMKVVPEEVRN